MEDIGELSKQKSMIDQELKRRKRAATKAQKDEEECKLIAAGEGERESKKKAIREAGWYAAEGKKRPHEEISAQEDNGAPKSGSRQGSRHSAGKKMKQVLVDSEIEEEQERGVREKKVAHRKGGNKHGPKLKPSAKPKPLVIESDSTGLSSLSDKEDDHALKSDDDVESEDGDDLDVSIGEKRLRKVFNEEAPQDPSNLFDNDNDIEMASVKSGLSRRSVSSEALRPPTSESEGLFDDRDESDDEQQLTKAKFSPYHNSSKTGKTKMLSKRNTALMNERPITSGSRLANVPKSSKTRRQDSGDEEDKVTLEKNWPEYAQLQVGGLLSQDTLIRALCRKAIKIVENTLVKEHAWPELHRAAAYKRQVLKEGVEILLGKEKPDKRYRDIQKRILKDDEFVKVIGRWVIDRLSHHRGHIRGIASNHIALFQLGIGNICKERVKALIENDVYVYPGDWAETEHGPIWMTKGSAINVQIYLNHGLIETIKDAFFATPTSFGSKFKALYVSSHPSQPEPEITIPLLALGATAFFAAIWEWREGKRLSKSKVPSQNTVERFDGDLFKTVFDRHVETLTMLKSKANTYHAIMSTVYSRVTANSTKADFGTCIPGNALAVLDLSGLD